MKHIASNIIASGFLISGAILLTNTYQHVKLGWLFILAGLAIPIISLYFNKDDIPKENNHASNDEENQ